MFRGGDPCPSHILASFQESISRKKEVLEIPSQHLLYMVMRSHLCTGESPILSPFMAIGYEPKSPKHMRKGDGAQVLCIEQMAHDTCSYLLFLQLLFL